VKIRVLVVDDHAMIRDGLKALLDVESDIDVVGEAEDGREAYDKVVGLHPDVVLMDIVMPVEDGIESSRRILRDHADTRIVILSQYADEESVRTAIQVGVCGYLPKAAGLPDIAQSIRSVYQGDYYFHSLITRPLIEDYRRLLKLDISNEGGTPLTPSESRVLKLVVGGYTSLEISKMLFVSVKTVIGHRAHVMQKLGVRNTTELIRYAIRKGVIRVGE